MSLGINNYNNSYAFKGGTVKTNVNSNQDRTSTNPAGKKVAVAGVIATGILAAGISLRGKGGQKIVSGLKKFYGKISGSTKKAEELKKTEETAKAEAQKRAEQEAFLKQYNAEIEARKAASEAKKAEEARIAQQKAQETETVERAQTTTNPIQPAKVTLTPELGEGIKKFWGKITGSTKRAEAARQEKLQAEWRAQEKAVEFEEKQAKLRAEREAKIRAKEARETELKAKQEAQIKAEQAAKLRAREEFQQNLIADFGKNFDLSIGERAFQNYPRELDKADAFENGIVSTLKKAENEGIEEDKVKTLYKTITEKHIISDEKIEERAKNATHCHGNEVILTRHDLKDRKSLIIDLDKMQKTEPQKDGEKYSDYIGRLIDTRKTKQQEQAKKHIKDIRANIRYDDTATVPQELTDEDMKALMEWRPGVYDHLSKRDALSRLSVANYNWVKKYTDDGGSGGVPENIETIMLSKSFKRYNPAKSYNNENFIHKPVARWIDVAGGKNCADYDTDRYVDETFKVGEKYVAPAKQSCAMDLDSAYDADFCDEGYKQVKFIIHPLAQETRAADLSGYADALCTQYGHYEVVYPKGTEFNVLDKRLEKVVHKDGKYLYRWIIEMQEAPIKK